MPEPVSQAPPSSRSRRRLTCGLFLVVIILGAVMLALMLGQQPRESGQEQSQQHSDETSAEPVCRADGHFVAGFMSPQRDDEATEELLAQMNADAVTFGGRIMPSDAEQYPAEVAEAIGDRDVYDYTVDMNWDGITLSEADQLIQVGETEYGLIAATENAVVMTASESGADVFHSLTRTASQRENNAYIGLPIPQMRTAGEPWLPDNSYADVVDGFAEKFVAAYHERGADGFYLAMEMPLTDVAHWDPVTDYYQRQTAMINDVSPGATVLISPYLEGRTDRETITPATAAAGYQKLLDLHNGTHVLVAPQDGVGVGTTALEADESAAHRYSVEDYFAALHEVDPENLYVTIEAMQSGDGPDAREPTTRDRIEQQLDATAPYVQGAIGYQWSGPTAMTTIDHIGEGACSVGPGELNSATSTFTPSGLTCSLGL